MILPKTYIDETSGVRPGMNESSFNNIVYTFWYALARRRQDTFNRADADAICTHIIKNRDEWFLYKPKNSHDNISYKMLFCLEFEIIDELERMSFFKAAKTIGLYRFWDIILYGAFFSSFKWLFKPFLFIPALFVIQSILVKYKVRPDWFDRGQPRYKWWFGKKTLVREEKTELQLIKTWTIRNGEKRTLRYMQNDGKHIGIFKLYTLSKYSWVFKLTSKICRAILISRYGKDYTYEVINKYFSDRKHPVIAMWKGYGDIL